MRALLLDTDGTLSLSVRPRPAIRDECLIRVTAAGICGTDLELLRGYADFSGVPGHEFVGVVEEASVADSAWIGRRVVGEITVGCGHCGGCRAAVVGKKEAESREQEAGMVQESGRSCSLRQPCSLLPAPCFLLP